MADLTCRSCGGRSFLVEQHSEKFNRNGEIRWVLIDSSWCWNCGEDVITTKQITINERRIKYAFKEQDNEHGAGISPL